MNFVEIFKHIARGQFTEKSLDKASQEIGNRQPQLKNVSQHNALGHAYATNLLGRGLLDFKERHWDEYENQQDLDNNKVAEQFFKDLPDMPFDDQMLEAKRSIFQREYMRNPQYNWQLYRNY